MGRMLSSMLGATTDGGVDGPSSTTNNALPRWSGTTGTELKNSGIICDDDDNVSGISQLTTSSLVVGALTGLLIATAGAVSATEAVTDNIAEGSNLYYTQERVDARFQAGLTPVFNNVNTNAGTHPEGVLHYTLKSTGGVNRFGIGLITNESGSNTGSNMLIFTYADNGAYLANAIGFRRSDGAITTGVWNASVIGATYGGTGQSSYTLGDTLYCASPNTLSKLSGNTEATRKFLRQTGNGAVSAAPAWDTILAADIPASALTKTDDTNVTLTLGGSASTALLNAASLTLGWTGELSPGRGGTGIASYTIGDLLYASNTTTLAKLAHVATGNALISGGVGGIPSWNKVGLTTHVSGTLPWANGGTGSTAFTDQSIIFSDGTKLTESPGGLTFVSSTSTLQVGGAVLTSTSVNGEVYNKIANASTGSSAYSILRLQNDTANNLTLRLNSSTNSSNGGTNAATLQNTAGILRLFASGGSGLIVNASSNVGVGVVPVNKFDVAGGLAVGVTYAGVNTVPSNGMLVEGQTIFGATSSFVNARVEIQGSDRITFGMGGTKTATDGVAQATFFVNPAFAPISSTTNCSTFLVYGQFNPPTGVTISTGYGLWFQSGGQGGLGSVTTGYNLYVENPGFGTTKIAAHLANVAVGYTGTTPPSGGAIISGAVGIGTNSVNAAAALEVTSTTKGIRFPNMTTTQKNAISSPPEGLVVCDTTLHKLCARLNGAWETITSA
jgi:hypothetical protein